MIQQINPELTDKLLLSMPNHYATIAVNGTTFPVSFMELSKPTGKYVYRVFIKLFNLFGRKGYIRIIGNACAPGIAFPNLSNIKAKELLGWEAKVGRAEGMKITYEYFKSLSPEELSKEEHKDFSNYIK